MVIWYIFPRFVIFCQEKSGNPADEEWVIVLGTLKPSIHKVYFVGFCNSLPTCWHQRPHKNGMRSPYMAVCFIPVASPGANRLGDCFFGSSPNFQLLFFTVKMIYQFKKWVWLQFGRFLHKPIWSPWHHPSH
jgi:hypothetical protein